MTLPHLSIRARTALAAAAVVGVVLALGSVGLILMLRVALRNSIRNNVATTASAVALLAKSGSLPDRLPGNGEVILVQVVDASSRVVASSPGVEGTAPLEPIALADGKTRTMEIAALPGHDASGEKEGFEPATSFVVVGQGVATPSGPRTVLAAASLSPLEDTSDALVPILGFGVPMVLLVVAAVTWTLTGSALGPVAAIRREAEAISSSLPDRRLPVPVARDEIRDLAETMNRMLDRIEAASLAQRRFSSDASHELKSPIAAIRTMLEVAQHDPAHADVPALLEDLLVEDRRLELLVSDLLLLGQSDEGALRLSLSRFDLGPLVEEEVASVVHPDGPRVKAEDVAPVHVVADAARVRQLLRNLLDNALRHAATRVWVAARAEAGQVVIEVSDDGPGIPTEARERVFERFFRLDDGRGRGEGGTGLGLSVCRAIVAAHGGAIRVAESAHAGATFEVRLPLEG